MGEHDQASARGLLLSRDLIFTTKIRDTAALLGKRIDVVGDAGKVEAILEAQPPALVLVDLAAGDLVDPGRLSGWIEQAGPQVHFLAFGSHVDREGMAAARAAGCHTVLPRSRFAAELPELIRRLLGSECTAL